ncbi:aminotransferase class I/II-fold pyridoxal phosphate-dependent enzyme [Bacillus sp. FJAT-45037]|uniref:aminotransferase class I/II-fold pyridoxal phosphate-dependent enzyme n=1 Tax=Bacillus sp. FJAT-45037 TaxID=2011007 RepID=UPI000C235134|nr:aminotransferase class I/II-fold pyridoxal phosphate-dependent enzyme [Bacillus sp. FJAT-45037]
MNHKGIKTPLIDALKNHRNRSPSSFHVPGHKSGKIVQEAHIEPFQSIYPYDVTELDGLDDLHEATGAILKAEQAAAKLYGAVETAFLVGGSTVGNLAMVHGLCEANDQVLMQRNSHKSMLNAIELFQVEPIFLAPEYEEVTGHALGPSVETVKQALEEYPKAKVLFLTCPNYYGVTIELKAIIEVAHIAGVLVCVDEAHGAHFVLGKPFPPSALQLGADVVVQSAHKMLPALTMGSFLHFHPQLAKAQIKGIRRSLTMLQSSSPSYLIMASLDGARAFAADITQDEIDRIIAGVQALTHELATIPQLNVVERVGSPYSFDPLKVTIKSRTQLSGFDLQKLFFSVGLDVELADEHHILLVFGLGTHWNRDEVVKKVRSVLHPYEVIKRDIISLKDGKKVAKLHVGSTQIRKSKKINVASDEAEGFIAAEAIIPYPPGVPVVYPGEVIDHQVITEVNQLHEAGATFQGLNPVKDGWMVIDLEEEQ